MKTTINILLIVLIIFSIQSCDNLGTAKFWKNDKIENEERKQIKILNNRLFKAIKSNNVTGVKFLLSDGLFEKLGDEELKNLVTQLNTILKSEKYSILDEYYSKNSKTELSSMIPSGFSDNDYSIHFEALNKEMYVSLLLPSDQNSELLVTAIYGKYDNHWKINILQIGQYSFFKKNAPEYYKLAMENYNNGYLIDAVNNIGFCKQCLRPANDFFQYQKEEEFNKFYEKVMKEANIKYTLPMTLGNIDSKPKVFKIHPQMVEEGYFPMVCYLSEINLKDTSALRIEYKKVKEEVNQIFRGINKNKKYVFYWAFNEIPDGKKLVEHFGYIDKITENK